MRRFSSGFALPLLLSLLLAAAASAQTVYYWDINGAAAGAGGATPAGTWDSTTANWTTDASGSAATTALAGTPIIVFAAGDDATGAYTVTRSGSTSLSELRVEEGTVTLAGSTLAFSGTRKIDVTASATANLTAAIGGAGVIQFTGGGTLHLSPVSNVAYSSDLSIAGGTLIFERTAVLSGTIVNDGQLVSQGASGSFQFLSSSISGTGSFRRTGSGGLTLTGTNTYTGDTVIDAGAGLTIGNNTQGSIVGNVVNNGSLTFFRSDDITFAGDISGAGNLSKHGAGVLTLSGSSTYTGTTTVGAGTLRAGAAGALASGAYTLAGGTLDLSGHALATGTLTGNGAISLGAATLTVNPTAAASFAGVISGTGALIKQGAVNLTLTAANTYTGGTTVSAGTLSLGGTAGAVAGDIVNSGTVAFIRTNDTTYGGVISGAGAVTKSSNTVLTLTGNHTYTGNTTVSTNGGTLQLGNGGTSGWLAGNVVLNTNASLRFNRSDDTVYPGVISGVGSVTKLGAGTLALTGTNTHTGGTMVSGGTLQIGNGGTSGSLTGAVTVNAGGNLGFNRTDSLTFGSAVSGDGTLTQAGAGTVILSGASTYTGGTFVNAGTLQVGNNTASSGIAIGSITGNVTVAAGANLTFARGSVAVTFPGAITGAGAVTKSGTGVLTFTSSDHDYTGGTLVSAGTLSIGNGGTTGWIAGNITNNGTLNFNRSDDVTFPGVISGTGTLLKNTAGTLKLTGANTYTGATSVTAGFIELSALDAFGSGTARNLTLNGGGLRWAPGTSADISHRLAAMGASGGKLDTNGNDVVFASLVNNNPARPVEKLGAGALILANTFSNTSGGPFTLSAGTLQIGNGGTTGSLTATLVNNAAVVFNRSDNLTHSLVISGTGSLTKLGAGNLTLSGANTYTGGTTITEGTLILGTGSVAGDIVNNAALVWTRSGSTSLTVDFANNISGTGTFTKSGAVSVRLTGTNAYTGGTIVTGGFVEFAGADAFGTGAIALDGGGLRWTVGTTTDISDRLAPLGADGGRFDTNGNDVVLATELAGAGGLTKSGAGTLTLAGANTYTGNTFVEVGTLLVEGSLDPTGTVTVAAGATLGGTGLVGGVATAAGGRLAPGSSLGTLTIDGDFEWNGSTNASATLFFELGGSDAASDRLVIVGDFLKGTGPNFVFDFQDSGVAGTTYTLATFTGTDFDSADFTATGLDDGLVGTFSLANGGTELHLTVAMVPVIDSPATADGTHGSAFSYTITATNSPASFSVTGTLPAGLALDSGTGVIGGTPTESGTFNVTLGATNSAGTGSAPLAITIAKAAATVTLSNLDHTFDGSPKSATVVTTPPGLATVVTYDGSPTAPSAAGTYTVVATVDDPNHQGTATATLTITVPEEPAPTPVTTTVMLGNLSRIFDGTPKPVTVTTNPAGLSVSVTYNGSTTPPSAAGTYTVVATVTAAGYTGSATGTLVIAMPPIVENPPEKVTAPIGGPAIFEVEPPSGPGPFTYQWQKDGVDLPGETDPTLNLESAQPDDVGLYSVKITGPDGASTVTPAVPLELTFDGRLAGAGTEVLTDVLHPNGNLYDQVLMTGSSVSVKADPGQVLRVSYVDLNDDIVQVEFSGAGVLTLNLENATGPLPAVNYNQPNVIYMKGHLSVTITDADETSHLSIFTVGRMTAVNQTLFTEGTAYDGVADIARVSIVSTDGKFGGLRTANASYFHTEGRTGVYAPGVEFTGPVFVGDINAADDAMPVLLLGAATDVRITGGSLSQDNDAPVEVSGIGQLQFTAGQDSHGNTLPVQPNQAQLIEDGVDVTDDLVGP